MNEFESDWISLSQSFVQNGWIQDGRIQDGRIQDGCHHQVNQIELVWVRVRVEGECFGVNLREDKKVSESNMAVSKSNMVEFKMAAIIKLSQNEWVKVFLCKWWGASVSEVFFVQMVGPNPGKCEWVWEEKLRWLNPRWPNSRWQNSRWLPSSSWVRINESSFLNPTGKNSRWLPSSSWVRMNEWSFFCANGGEESVSEVFFVQMVGPNPGKCEWVWEEKLRWLNPRWPNSRWQNSRWLPSSSWVRMNEFESD